MRLHRLGSLLHRPSLLLRAWRRRARSAHELPAPAGNDELDLHRLIVESVSDAIVLWRVDGRIVLFSPSAERLFGWSGAEVIGRPLSILLAPEHHPPYERAVSRWRESGRGRRLRRPIVLRCMRADGRRIPAELLIGEHRSGDGGDLRVGVFRDLSDRLRAAEADRRSESLRGLIEGLPDAVLVHRDERLVYANRTLLEHLGYPNADAVIGRRLRELIHPDDVGAVLQRLAELEQSGKPLPPREERFRAADGRTVRFEVAKVPVEFDGAPAIVAIGRDLSERKLAEDRFRIAVESAPSGMVMIDGAGRIVLANRQATSQFGYDEGELVGRSVEVLVPERYRSEHPRMRALFAEDPSARVMGSGRNLHGLRKDGSELPVEIGLNPIVTREGAMVLASVVDISERRRNQALLAAADRMSAVGTLAAGVAHGINNPLSFIKGNVYYARGEMERLAADPDTGTSLAEAIEALRQAEEGANRIRDIVTDLLTFSRGDRGRQRWVDLHSILESVLNMAQNEIRHRGRVVKRLGDIPPVAGDESKIAHALANLIVNASQALHEGDPEGQEIRITTRSEEPGMVVVEIEDTGSGIDPEIRSLIFDPFFTTKPTGEGTGLGLAVTHGIVASLDGKIEVESGPEGGALFRVLLPAASQRQPAAPGPEAPRLPDRRSRLLVVDDEQRVLEAFHRMLGDDFDVTGVRDGREALTRIEAGEAFDAILCDLMMPGMDGEQLHESLQEKAPELVPRLIFVTGGAFTALARRFVERVDNIVLTKPVERHEAVKAIVEVTSGEADAIDGMPAGPEAELP